MATDRVCIDCPQTFEWKGTKGHPLARCPACKREHLKAQKRANPDIWRKYQYKHNFGITIAEYDLMLKAQGGHCDLCPRTACDDGRRLHVDHDHATGKVRALLCHNCNRALGLMKDDPDLLRRAANYLEHHRSLRCA